MPEKQAKNCPLDKPRTSVPYQKMNGFPRTFPHLNPVFEYKIFMGAIFHLHRHPSQT
jgi:hypothetical protein